MSNIYGRQVVLPLTNKTGGPVVVGDVVVIDAANNDAFTTTTTGQSQTSVGIAQETIASNAIGRVLVSGYAALVNVPASVTRGHYVETHTVAKQATGNSTRRAGSFGQFLTGGTTPTAWLWGFPDNAGAAGETLATSTLWDTKGDIAMATGADTAAKHPAPSNGKLIIADSAQSTGWRDTFGLYHARRIIGQDLGNADATFNVNSSSYVGLASAQFYHDWDVFPATHFLITCYGHSNESGQTVTLQYATQASPGTGYSASGNDLAVGFNGGANTNWSSGWVAVSGTPTGLVYVTIAFKGSNATVDLVGRWIDIAFKVV